MAANVGYATLQIIPSVKGISDELRSQLVGPAAAAGKQAGEEAGGGLSDSIKGVLEALSIVEIAKKIGETFQEAFSDALEQGNIVGTLQAQLGTTGPQAAKLGKIAGKLYSSGVSDTFEDAADAIKNVAQSGLLPPNATNKQLQSIATKASDVANTFGQDFESVTNAASRLVAGGLVKNSGQALDLITTGFQVLGPKADDLLDTFNEYSVQFQKLGLSGQQSLGLIQQGIKAGAASTDLVADAMKEFSIRAVDGSATTIAGFKGLGLSAKDMATQIGKGGSSASKGLDVVLDRLRKVPDPVKRAQLATDLFGTQSEDLGKALFALDPSKATKAIGDFGGAASKVGKTIRSGPSYELQTFQRTLQQGLVNFLGSKVIPIVSKWGQIFVTDVLPPLTKVGGVLSDTFIPAVHGVADVVSGTVGWFQKWGIWLAPLAILIGGLTLALNANAIATALVTGILNVYRAAMLIGEAVTGGFSAAMGLLNAVMALNPFVLVAIAVVALGAAMVIAYQKSATFRAIIQGAWSGIQIAISAAWSGIKIATAAVWSFLQVVFGGIETALSAIGTAASWLWSTILSPVFSAIATGAKILLTALVVIVLVPIIAAFKLIGATAMWLWTNALAPAFAAIGALGLWLWTNVFSPVVTFIVGGFNLLWTGVQIVFGLFMTGIRALGSVALWLWSTAISPVVTFILGGFKLMWSGVQVTFGLFMTGIRALGSVGLWLWRNIFSPVVNWIVGGAKLLWAGVKIQFNALMTGVRAVGSVGTWLWKNAIAPAFHGVESVISTVWSKGIKPAFSALKTGVHAIGDAFGTAKNAIGKAWNQIESIAKKPIAYVVNTVYDKGIVPVWNKVAGAFGAPKLATQKFATGGVVNGAGTATSDSVPAWLSSGEHVWTAKEVQGAGGHGAVSSMRQWAAAGGGPSSPGFKSGGGLFGWIGTAASALKGAGSDAWNGIKKGASWLKDTIEGSAKAGMNALVNPLISRIPGAGSGFGKVAASIPKKMLDSVFGFSKKADSKGGAGIANPTGSGVNRWRSTVVKALSANGLSTSASMVARVLRQIATESGGNPNAVQGNIGDINNKTGDLAKGLMQTISATFNSNKFPGHGNIFNGYDNLLAALHYAKNRYGPSLSFLGQGHGYANGTTDAAPGWSVVGERGWELANFGKGGGSVLSHRDSVAAVAAQAAAQTAAATASRPIAGMGGAQVSSGLQPGDRLALVLEDGTAFGVYVDKRADGRVQNSYQQLTQAINAK